MNKFGLTLIAFAAVCVFPACYAVPVGNLGLPWNSASVVVPSLPSVVASGPLLESPLGLGSSWGWLNSCLSPASSLALNTPLLSSVGSPLLGEPCLDGLAYPSAIAPSVRVVSAPARLAAAALPC